MSKIEKIGKERPILSVKSAMCYAFGIFGVQLIIGYINGYQSQFYTSMFGADLMIVAVIILGSKLISSFIDPLFGRLIDKSNFKSGKMKPFILISALPFAIITTVMFVYIPFSTKAGMYVYITFLSVVWNIAMSLADISSQGMLALLSPRSSERNMAAGVTNTLKSIGLAANGVIVPIICMITGSEGIGKMEYLIAALVMCIVGSVLFILIYFFNKEVVPTTRSSLTMREMGRELKSNKMLFIVFLTFMLGFGRNIQMGIGVQTAAVFFKDGIDFFGQHMAGENLPWLLGISSMITSMLAIVLVPSINKRWGEKKTFIVFAIYGLAASIITFGLYASGVPALRSVWAILVYQFLLGFSVGPVGFLPMVMVSDIVDYQEWKTGKRTEGTQFAVLSMSNKISNALSVAVGIFICGAAGYNAKNIADGVISVTANMQTIVSVAYFLVPGVCMVLSMIPMFWYKINQKVKDEMHHDLDIKWGMNNGDSVAEKDIAVETVDTEN
ncbi:MAG: MFS transporter [Clostridia bacterium]